MTNEELYYLPASELLKHIQAEKERLIKEKVIKKSKPLSILLQKKKNLMNYLRMGMGSLRRILKYWGLLPKKMIIGMVLFHG